MEYDDEDHLVINHPCPKCGNSPVLVMLTCHTYQQSGHWVSCMPCSSAGVIFCNEEDCDWAGYYWGINPKNPRAANNENYRPEWLIGDWPWS